MVRNSRSFRRDLFDLAIFCGHDILAGATQSIVIDIVWCGFLYATNLYTGLVHILLKLEITLASLTLSHTVVHVPVGTWLLIRTTLNRDKITVPDHTLFVGAKEVLFAATFVRGVTISSEINVYRVILLSRWIQIDVAHTFVFILLDLGGAEWLLFAEIYSAHVIEKHVLIIIHLLLALTLSRIGKAWSGGIKIHDLWS